MTEIPEISLFLYAQCGDSILHFSQVMRHSVIRRFALKVYQHLAIILSLRALGLLMVKIDHNILRRFRPLSRLLPIANALLDDGCLSPVTNAPRKTPLCTGGTMRKLVLQ